MLKAREVELDRFAIRPGYLIEHSASAPDVHSRAKPRVQGDEDVIEILRAQLPQGLELVKLPPDWDDVVSPPPHEPFVSQLPKDPTGLVDPSIHWGRIAKMQAQLKALNVTGFEELTSLPAGWVSVLEAAVDGWVELLANEPDAAIKISQIKEKFGILRVYTGAVGSTGFKERAEHIRNWAQIAGTSRCMITGRLGYQDADGWVVTLCPQAMVWRRIYPDAFIAAVFPKRPLDRSDG